MMLKVNNEYLEFNADIEVERQIKLFEELSTTDGDYSYQFEIDITSENIRKMGLPFPDNISKNVYQKVKCQAVSDNGLPLYDGYFRIERITRVFHVSFFSGNNNWFGLLSGPMSDIDFSDLDTDQTQANIVASWPNTSGVVFPLVDNGALFLRGYRHLKIEDFVPAVYVHTIFKRIFQKHSIKIQGDLLQNGFYNKLISQRNSKSQEQIDASSSYVQKTTTTARPVELDDYKITFQNDSVYPYYDGTNDSFDLAGSRWIAPARMKIQLEASFVPSIVDSSYSNRIYIYINGVFTFVDVGLSVGGLYNDATPGDQATFTIDRTFIVEQGDIIELYSEWQQSLGSTQNDILSGWVKITPIFIYKAFGNAIVPQWTQQEFVANILRIFNVLTHYESITKTLTFDLFENIKTKAPTDISEFISKTEVDYSEFISNFAKRNLLGYQEVDFDDLRDYNIQNFFKFGQGSVNVDNDFLADSQNLVESDFSHPQGYINSVFDMSMDRLNLIVIEQDKGTNATAVTDSAGVARFAITEDIFLVDDLVSINDSTVPNYEGDWIVSAVGAGYVEFYGLPFNADAVASLTKFVFSYNETDDVYLMVNIPSYDVSNFSGFSNIHFEDTDYTNMATAYFNLLNTGRQINDDYRQSLSFGEISSPFFYQRTMIETFWSQVGRVLNDPVKLFSTVNLPYHIFIAIDFLSPFTIRTLESSNMYYLNRATGYKGKEKDAILELIKLP